RIEVSRYCEQVRSSLSSNFVPEFLGTELMNRQEWLQQNTPLAKEIFSLKDDELVVIADGTYIYCQKSTNNFFQRKSYSVQKKRSLV
ncbi:unnamed protein product, partial [Brachionus calyciflorus]